jgi:hypothetical protein
VVAKTPYRLELVIDPPALLCLEGSVLAHQAAGHPDSSAIYLARRIVIAILSHQETLTIGFTGHAQEEDRNRKATDEEDREDRCPF